MHMVEKNRKIVRLKIKRQDGPNSNPYWEEFDIEYRSNMNVITALMDIQKNPVNAQGKRTKPVIWESNCLEEVCGACTMIINGTVRQACSTLIKDLKTPIVLEPLSKFPVVRDLMVDRSEMFESLKKVKAWVPIDGTFYAGPGPVFPEKQRKWAYDISRCMTCGACLEACPQVNDKSSYLGPAAVAQVMLFNIHPTGKMLKDERLDVLRGKGGIWECGNSQNCVEVCPKKIPLTDIIAELNRETNLQGLLKFLSK